MAVLNKQALKALEDANPGDLICVDWCDGSTGKSSMNGGVIDVPVRGWGVFLGVMEGRVKHMPDFVLEEELNQGDFDER